MTKRDHRIQPYKSGDGAYRELGAFAARVVPLLVPEFELEGDWERIDEVDVPWESVDTTYRRGTEHAGLEARHHVGLEPRAGGHAVDRVIVRALGLPDGVSFEIECARSYFDARFLEVRVEGPNDAALDDVMLVFDREHAGEQALSDDDAKRELLSIKAALRSRAWRAAALRAEWLLAKRPEWAELHFALGLALGATGDEEAAEPHLLRTLALDPNHVDARYNLGVLHQQREQHEEAIEVLQRALEIDADNHPALHRLGLSLEAVGRTVEALQTQRRALATSPNPHGWSYRGLDFTAAAKDAIERLTADH